MQLTDIIKGMASARLTRHANLLTGGTKCVEGIVITAGGTGYSNSFAVTATGGGGSGFAATATAIGGVIRTVTVTNPGSGYTSAPTLDFTAGSGSGATGSVTMGAKALDAIATTNLTTGIVVSVAIGGIVYTYRLDSGTTTEASPAVIRPDDYATTTNEKIWTLLGDPDIAAPTTLQSLAAGAAILANGPVLRVEGSGGAVTLTSAPTIADGADGQRLTIVGSSDTNTLTLQDQGTLASSNLELGASTRQLGKGDVLSLIFIAADGLWYETGFVNN